MMRHTNLRASDVFGVRRLVAAFLSTQSPIAGKSNNRSVVENRSTTTAMLNHRTPDDRPDMD
ncbi:MAG: hypothetical protein R3C19_21415 [Planctomycetaceae bacterium]